MIRGIVTGALASSALFAMQFSTQAVAQGASPPVRPIATSAVGPWEIVVWGAGKRVHQCTLVRAQPKTDEPKFGILVDHRGVVLSVDTAAWQLTSKVEVLAALAPAAGGRQEMVARPVSPTRANIGFDVANPLLDRLQASDYFDIRINGVTVRVKTEDFNAARVVFDICVEKIGADWRAATG
jgi:hypothetical protein